MKCVCILMNPRPELRSNINYRLLAKGRCEARYLSAQRRLRCRSATKAANLSNHSNRMDAAYDFRPTTSAAQTAAALRRIPDLGGCADRMEGSRPNNNDGNSQPPTIGARK